MRFIVALTAGVVLLAGWGCEDSSSPGKDSIPPAAVFDLRVTDSTTVGVTLAWTSPGDDGTEGEAFLYDLRYSTTGITGATWTASLQVADEPAPAPPGTEETFTVTGLFPGTAYSFALRTRDEVEGNWSPISNVASTATVDLASDSVPPATVSDLVAVDAETTFVTLTWTAPGDDGGSGRAALYEFRFSVDSLTEASWSVADTAAGEPPPHPAGSPELYNLGGLQKGTVYFFGMKSADEEGNWSGLSNIARDSTAVD